MRVSREIEPSPETGLKPGDKIGGYQIEKLIGVGGMADVFLARHGKLDKLVAVKVLRAHARERADLRARFLREGQAASRIRNPHVVEIFDVGTDEDVPYLVMQYLPGPTLEEHLAERGALDVQEAVHIFLPIAAAVAAGHEEGVIHRDLKPDNVILAVEGHRTRPTVLDFGVSRLVTSDPRLTLDSSVVGTPHYMSPEQARGEQIDSKTDQYALGVMLYQAVTSRLPRDRASVLELINEVGHRGFEPPTKHRATLPRDFEDVILTAMAPSRKQRFATMHDMAAALLPFASENARVFWAEELGIKATRVDAGSLRAPHKTVNEHSTTLPPAPPAPVAQNPTPTPEPKSNRGLILGVLGLLAAAIGIALAVFLLRSEEPEDYVADVEVSPPVATLTLDGELVGRGEAHLRFEADGTTHRLEVAAPGYVPRVITFRDAPPPERVSLTPESAAEEPGEVAGEVPATAEPTALPDPAAPPAADDARGAQPTEVATGGEGGEPARRGRRRGRDRAPEPAPAAAEPPAAETPPAEPPATPPASERAPDWRPTTDRTDNLDPWTR